MSASTTERSGSQNDSERRSSKSTSTAACSELPQRFCTVPLIPAKSLFQCPSLTRTTVPLRASYACKSLDLLIVVLVAAIMTAPTPELPSHRRVTLRAAAPSFAIGSASKAPRFRHRSARPPPGSRDDHRSVLWCRRALSQAACLHPELPPTCRF